jgi:hypothetical protein
MPLGELFRNNMRSMHAKFNEFSMHRNDDMNLSLFSFSEFCRLAQQEFRRFNYMNDVVMDEGIPTNLT